MMHITTKRCLSLVMVLVLTFSLLPLGAAAEENGEEPHLVTEPQSVQTESVVVEETTALVEPMEATEPEESAAYLAVQAAMDDIMGYYLGTTDLTVEEAVALVAELDPYDTAAANMEIYELEYSDEFLSLTEAEQQALVENNAVFCAFADAVSEKAALEGAISTYTDVNMLDGQITISDNQNTGSVSGTKYTATVTSSTITRKTNTITITNKTDKEATLQFDYSVVNIDTSETGAFKIGGVNKDDSTSGSHSGILAAGGTLTLSFRAPRGLGNKTATLTLINFSLTPVVASSTVTFKYETSLGSITVDGVAMGNDGKKENIQAGTVLELAATPVNGATFLGWADADNKLLSQASSYSLEVNSPITVKAVFGSSSKACFCVGPATQQSVSSGLLGMSSITYYKVGCNYIFDDLNAAATKASSDTSNKVVTLLNNAALAAGDYTIPAGVTLLIPFDDGKTMYTTEAPSLSTQAKTAVPSAYRTLTLADGATLTINGALSVSGQHQYAGGGDHCRVVGKVGFIKMEGSSNITINNGGALYTYGYVTGSGTVTANSGATIYELFQFMGFRGGTVSTENYNGVFPLSQYYVQNVEVPMTIYSGAKEYAYTTIYMSSSDFGTAVNFIGTSNAMFNLSSGYAVKSYDGTTDRLNIDLYGNATLSSIDMDIGTGSINSAAYELPINNNITIHIHKDTSTTVNQDIAILPGSEVIVDKGATCTLGSGINMYIYDAEQWGNYVFSHDPSNSTNTPIFPLKYAPGRATGVDRWSETLADAYVLLNGTLDASAGYIYTTESGANIHSTGNGIIKLQPGTQTATYQMTQKNSDVTTDEILITPAKLKNADGTYVDTSADTYTYELATGVWHNKNCDHVYTAELISLPSYTTEGKEKRTCTCGTVSKESSIPKVVQLAAFAASAAEEIILDLKVNLPDTVKTVIATQSVMYKDDDGNTQIGEDIVTYTVDVKNKTVSPTDGACFDVNGRFVVSRGVASGEMTQPVTLTFLDAAGGEIKFRPSGITQTSQLEDDLSRTVVDYAALVLQQNENITDTEKLEKIQNQKKMITYLLTYGGYAQIYFNVDATYPAYDLLTEFELDIPDISTVSDATITQALTTSDNSIGITALSTQQSFLDSAIYHRVYFTLDNGSDINNYKFEQGFPVNNADAYQMELTPVYESEKDRYYVDILDVPAAYLDYMYTITVTNKQTQENYTVQTSVLAYLKNLLANSSDDDQKNLAKAMYLYNQAANDFFGK